MMKTFLTLLLCLLLPLAGAAEASPAEVVTAQYEFWQAYRFIGEEVTLRVFDNGSSEVALRFRYVPDQRAPVPEEPILRLVKVDGTEGLYGQAPLILHGKNESPDCVFTATVPLDRALGKSELLTFAICRPDGSERFRIKCRLADFTSSTGSWPVPESTAAVPSIPPVSPTALPTMRPTLPPAATEPPQDTALFTANFVMREYTANYTSLEAIMRIYPNDVSALTVRFKYDGAIPEDAFFRLTMVDGRVGYFGEATISPPDEQGVREVVILFNQQVGSIKNFNLDAFVPGSQKRLFKAFYKLSGKTYAWEALDLDPIATVVPDATPTPSPLPADVTAAPSPTVPTGKPFAHVRFGLLDPVKYFRLKSAYHDRYDNGISVLTIQFRYDGELPAKPMMRITQKEYTEGNFGEAIALWDEKEDGLLTVTIVTDQLQGSCRACRLKCYDEKGRELFYADLGVSLANELWSGGYEETIARSMLPTATPEPINTPAPTPTIAPTADPAASPTPAPEEPPYSEARHKRKFLLLDKVTGYSHYNVTLRRYAEVDVLTVYFRYKGGLPDGAKLRLIRVDTLLDSFGEALILPSELKNASADLLCAKIPSDRIPLNCTGLRLEAVSAEGEVLFTADFYPEEGTSGAKDARTLLNAAFEDAAPKAE